MSGVLNGDSEHGCAESAVIYARSATDGSDGQMKLDIQVGRCARYASGTGLDVGAGHIVAEVASGLSTDRRGLNTLEGLIRGEQVDVVLVTGHDRLFRSAIELLRWVAMMDGYGVRLVAVDYKEVGLRQFRPNLHKGGRTRAVWPDEDSEWCRSQFAFGNCDGWFGKAFAALAGGVRQIRRGVYGNSEEGGGHR